MWTCAKIVNYVKFNEQLSHSQTNTDMHMIVIQFYCLIFNDKALYIGAEPRERGTML